jgi:hypothetical protein
MFRVDVDNLKSYFDFASTPNGRLIFRSSWNALIPSRKKEILRYFASLKSPVAKVRN